MGEENKIPVTPESQTPAPTDGEKPGETQRVKVDIGGKKTEQKPTETKPTEEKPYAVFPDAKSFMDRVEREAKKQTAEQIKEAAKAKGLTAEKLDDLLALAEEGHKAVEARKTAEQKAEEERQALIKAKEEAETRGTSAVRAANEKLIAADLKLLANEMGASVSPKVLKAALDLSAVKVDDDGNVTGLKEALEALKATEPAMFTAKEPAKPVSTPTAPVAADPSKMDAKAMTPEQFKDYMWKTYHVRI